MQSMGQALAWAYTIIGLGAIALTVKAYNTWIAPYATKQTAATLAIGFIIGALVVFMIDHQKARHRTALAVTQTGRAMATTHQALAGNKPKKRARA